MTNTVASRSRNDRVGLGLLAGGFELYRSFLELTEPSSRCLNGRTSRSGPGDGEIWLGLLKTGCESGRFFSSYYSVG
jgi:hypothetical protein